MTELINTRLLYTVKCIILLLSLHSKIKKFSMIGELFGHKLHRCNNPFLYLTDLNLTYHPKSEPEMDDYIEYIMLETHRNGGNALKALSSIVKNLRLERYIWSAIQNNKNPHIQTIGLSVYLHSLTTTEPNGVKMKIVESFIFLQPNGNRIFIKDSKLYISKQTLVHEYAHSWFGIGLIHLLSDMSTIPYEKIHDKLVIIHEILAQCFELYYHEKQKNIVDYDIIWHTDLHSPFNFKFWELIVKGVKSFFESLNDYNSVYLSNTELKIIYPFVMKHFKIYFESAYYGVSKYLSNINSPSNLKSAKAYAGEIDEIVLID